MDKDDGLIELESLQYKLEQLEEDVQILRRQRDQQIRYLLRTKMASQSAIAKVTGLTRTHVRRIKDE